jgi:opacity protein-like surface antigen
MRNLALTILLVAIPCLSFADSNRGQNWEVSVSGVFQESLSIDGANGSSLDINSDTGFGINFAYNLSSKLSFGADFEFLRPNYTAVLKPEDTSDPDIVINHKISQFNGRLKATFNMIDGPFTPFLEGGLGWSYFDSNVADGPPSTGCYWHPWWGYICNSYYSTFTETEFSYGIGGGLRYEFVGGMFVKASYNFWEMDGLGNAEDSGFTATRLEIGGTF